MGHRKSRQKSLSDGAKERIIRFVFDPESIKKISPGLKMIYALNDMPLFVQLDEIKGDAGDRYVQS